MPLKLAMYRYWARLAPLFKRLYGSTIARAAASTRTLGLFGRLSPVLTTFVVVITMISALAPVSGAWVSKQIVDTVVHERGGHTIEHGPRFWVLIEMFIVTTVIVLDRASDLINKLVGSKTKEHVTIKILQKTTSLSLAHLEDQETSHQISAARQETSTPMAFLGDISTLAAKGLMAIAYCVLLYKFSPWIVVGVVSASLPLFISDFFFATCRFKTLDRRGKEGRKLGYLENVLSGARYGKETTIFNSGPRLIDRYRKMSEQFMRGDRSLALRQTFAGCALSLLSNGSFALCYIFIADAASNKTISIGQMTLYLLSIRRGRKALDSVLGAAISFWEHSGSLSSLYSFLDTSIVAKHIGKIPSATGERGIQFDRVSFKYPSSSRWAINDVSFLLEKNQSLAIVGANGSGKSTLLKLLLGMYEPTAGKIVIDGVGIPDWNKQELYKRVSVLFQDYNKYEFSLRENISISGHGEFTDEQVLLAAQNGGADEIISKLELGLDTPMGHSEPSGVQLSEGQWQRVALGRAFMRTSADILVLDEPTAAMDPQAQHALYRRFNTLTNGRTSIIVTHRLSMTRLADVILLMDNGSIKEKGSYQDLVHADGEFAKLLSLQGQDPYFASELTLA